MPSAPPPLPSLSRLLVLSPPDSTLPEILQGCDSPTDPHLNLSTPYYTASIPIWHDTLKLSTSHIQSWDAEWKSPEAAEVVRSIGAWAVCFPKPADQGEHDAILHLLRTVSSLIAHHLSTYDDPPLLLAIALPQSRTQHLLYLSEKWRMFEDECQETGDSGGGWELIDAEAASTDGEGKVTRNEFGEKTGMERVKEALEAHEWVLEGGEAQDRGGFLGLDEEIEGEESREEGGDSSIGSSPLFTTEEEIFGVLQAPLSGSQHAVGALDASSEEEHHDFLTTLTTPLLPASLAIHHPSSSESSKNEQADPAVNSIPDQQHSTQKVIPTEKHRASSSTSSPDDLKEGSESQIGDLEQMMLRLQAVREMGADLPELERKRAAKKAVEGVMRML